MLIKKPHTIVNLNRHILPEAIILIFSVLLLVIAPVFEVYFSKIVSTATYLTWHNIFELTGIVACIAIFLLAYYTYNQTGRLRTILLGSMLLSAGVIDIFHMLSYKGMPAFFIENTSANRATTFWIAGRLVFVFAMLVAGLLTDKSKCTVNRNYLAAAALLVSFVVFIIATYFPNLLPEMYIEGYGLTTTKKLLEYFIMVMLLFASVLYLRIYLKNKDNMFFTIFFALLLSVLSEFAFTLYVDVYGLYNYLGHIFKVIAFYMIFKGVFVKNIQMPYIELTAAQTDLKNYADNLDKKVEQRTHELKIINERLLEDIKFAREIQKAMLPSYLPDTQSIQFSALYMPAERLSGDFYDVFELDENNVAFYVCDVSGHGVPAAMLTVFLKQCIDGIAEADRHKGLISRPSDVLQKVYDAFNHSNFKDDVYIVLIYFIYETKKKRLTFSSAGMNTIPVLLNSNGSLKEIDIRGFPICKLKDVCTITYTEHDIPVKSGDKLFLYTDGLTEARNSSGGQFSPERLIKLIKANCSKTLVDQTISITDDINDFSAGIGLKDDVTLLAVEIR